MSKNEQTVKALSDMIQRLRDEQAAYNKDVDNKIAGLEIAYEALTGEKVSTVATPSRKAPVHVPRKMGRRGMKIDRQGAAKTFAFLQERGEKPTTVKMVARKFGITPEAASQRLLNLYKANKTARVEKGGYIDAALVKAGGSGSNATKNETEAV